MSFLPLTCVTQPHVFEDSSCGFCAVCRCIVTKYCMRLRLTQLWGLSGLRDLHVLCVILKKKKIEFKRFALSCWLYGDGACVRTLCAPGVCVHCVSCFHVKQDC